MVHLAVIHLSCSTVFNLLPHFKKASDVAWYLEGSLQFVHVINETDCFTFSIDLWYLEVNPASRHVNCVYFFVF